MREMKDSGIKWIGKIPADWTCCKQKFYIRLVNGRAYSDFEFETDGKYKILRVGNLYTNPVWYTSSLELTPEKYCDDGDLLYSWSMSYGPIIWHGEKVIYHYHIWKALLDGALCKKFTFYYLSSLTSALMAEKHETTMSFITMGVMNNSYIAVPSYEEQYLIASFLDAKCAEIDALTADIQEQIDVLELYKRSVITEAVTKGMNPDTEMKDSGIEFIGEIPANWIVSKIKYFGKIRNGLTYTPNDICDQEEGILVLRSSNIKGGKITFNESVYVSCPIKKDLMVCPGDILICSRNGSRELIGKNALIEDITATFGAFMMIFRCQRPKYMYYILNSSIFSYYLGTFFTSTINQLTGANFGNMVIPYSPNLEECNQIVAYLDAKCAEIDDIIKHKREQIATLEEYKKSLIFEYVTGKKEV